MAAADHPPFGLYLGDQDSYRLGLSMMRRYEIAARFVAERHPAEFERYWEQHWTGEATGADFLEAVREGLSGHLVAIKRPDSTL
jgi:hypothetical protein